MQNNFEDINKSGGMQPSVSFEKAWASLQPQLDKEAERRKKKRRRVVFFWLSLIAICLVSGLVYKNGNTGGNGIVGKTNLPKVYVKPTSPIVNIAPAMVSIGLAKDKQIRTSTTAIAIESGKDKLRINPNTNTLKKVIPNKIKWIKENIQSKEIAASNKTEVALNKEIALTEKGNNGDEAKPIAVNKLINDTTTSVAAANNSIDTLKKVDSTVDKKALAKDNKKSKKELLKGIHFGLQFNAPIHAGINTLDVNAKKQPLSMFIPQVFVSKQLSKKSSLYISATPYAQFYLNNSVVLSSGTYNVTVQQGSTQDSKPKQYVYRETVGINKLITIEATIGYQYQLSKRIKLGVGIANNWLQGALLQTKVTMNGSTITRDSLYGNNHSGRDWKQLQSSFLLGKLEVGYQYKSLEAGAVVSMPLGNIATNGVQYKTPINTNLFVRWNLK